MEREMQRCRDASSFGREWSGVKSKVSVLLVVVKWKGPFPLNNLSPKVEWIRYVDMHADPDCTYGRTYADALAPPCFTAFESPIWLPYLILLATSWLHESRAKVERQIP